MPKMMYICSVNIMNAIGGGKKWVAPSPLENDKNNKTPTRIKQQI